jgi:hypothetical protein
MIPVTAIFLISFALAVPAASGQPPAWQARSDVPDVALVGTDETDAGIAFHFRNLSEKRPVASTFQFTSVDGSRWEKGTVSLMTDVQGPAHDEVFDVRLSAEEARAVRDRSVALAAAVFGDRSAEGNARAIQLVRFEHLGRMIAVAKVAEILQRASEWPDDQLSRAAISKALGPVPQFGSRSRLGRKPPVAGRRSAFPLHSPFAS